MDNQFTSVELTYADYLVAYRMYVYGECDWFDLVSVYERWMDSIDSMDWDDCI